MFAIALAVVSGEPAEVGEPVIHGNASDVIFAFEQGATGKFYATEPEVTAWADAETLGPNVTQSTRRDADLLCKAVQTYPRTGVA